MRERRNEGEAVVGGHGYLKAFPSRPAQGVTKLRNDVMHDHLHLHGYAFLYFVRVTGNILECSCT